MRKGDVQEMEFQRNVISMEFYIEKIVASS